MKKTPRLRRVVLRNYRSIGHCVVDLDDLTFLVGPNGSGKSNFLDALRFVSEALRVSLEFAIRERGGIAEVRRRSSGHPTHFGIRLDMEFPDGRDAMYAFSIGAQPGGDYRIRKEECRLGGTKYRIEDGQLIEPRGAIFPRPSTDRLYLGAAAGLEDFRPCYSMLSGMVFLNPVPDAIRAPRGPDPGEFLARDSRNLASIYERMHDEDKKRVLAYLREIVPGVVGVEVRSALGLETIEFCQEHEGHPWRFQAISMSDGTLRALAILVSLFHPGLGRAGNLIGLEEPEMALNPGAAGPLFDALVEASMTRQVVVTTHSPDLLDRREVPTEWLRAVVMDRGRTVIAPVDPASREVLQQGLYTAGELLRLGQIAPDPEQSNPRQLDIFARG